MIGTWQFIILSSLLLYTLGILHNKGKDKLEYKYDQRGDNEVEMTERSIQRFCLYYST